MRSLLKTAFLLGSTGIVSCGGGSSGPATSSVGGSTQTAAGGTSSLRGTTMSSTWSPASGGANGSGGSRSGSGGLTGVGGNPTGGRAAGGNGATSTGVFDGGRTGSGGTTLGGTSARLSTGGSGATAGATLGIGGTQPTSTVGGGTGGASVSGSTSSSPATTGGSTGTTIPTCGSDQYTKPAQPAADEDGSQLWLRYKQVAVPGCLAEYQAHFAQVVKAGSSDTLQAAQTELVKGLAGIIGKTVPTSDEPTADGAVILGTPTSSAIVQALSFTELASVGDEGYVVRATQTEGKNVIVIAGNTDMGVLYGTFALLRHLSCNRTVEGLTLNDSPKVKYRVLDHWDDLNGSVERGYAGKSLWQWGSLPGTISQRYKDYARANASLGINGVVLNNVNAEAQILTSSNIDKVAALASAFRPYGIKVYLSAQFGAPKQIGNLSTADPTDSAVKQWWVTEANTIYQKIPDFGGFLVKANSEGQPGPGDYNRSHADGANMLATALSPHGGIVMWRAFVYKDDGTDRIGQAYNEFKPLDGKFSSGVIVQVKNGPLDFQPREPFHQLFGAMPKTPLALELQITKEYLGEDTHLVYLAPMWEEILKADTYAKGQGSTVAKVIDGSLHGYSITAMAGVANVGTDTNWSGSHFNQANWYAFGRLAWNPEVAAKDIADEWIRQTFTNDPAFVKPVTDIMMSSHQTTVNYMTPLGLVHIMGTDHHYGPAPWVSNLSQANWNPVYYHKADTSGIGFDRTSTGSNTVSMYSQNVRDVFASNTAVPDDVLLFFHHKAWGDTLASTSRTVWNELVYRYSSGVDSVQSMRTSWGNLQGYIDAKRFSDVSSFLQIQHYEARWWRDACLQYFASVGKQTIPSGYAAPAHPLSWYQALTCPSDATKPRCPDIQTGTPSPAITQ